MNIASVERAEISGNGVRIIIKDSNGLKRELNLSPLAEQQLATALMSAPPAEIGKKQPRGPFVAMNVRLSEDSNGLVVLEAALTQKSAVHIALPNPLPERLRDLLSQDCSQWRDSRIN